jgi:hypothetical protein
LSQRNHKRKLHQRSNFAKLSAEPEKRASKLSLRQIDPSESGQWKDDDLNADFHGTKLCNVSG